MGRVRYNVQIMSTGLTIYLLFIVLYAVVAVWLGRRSITMPMFFLVVGAITGAEGLGWVKISLSSEDVKILVEVTLALLLFADSSTLKLQELKVDGGLPARLILIALPLVILLGGLVAFGLFPQEGFGFAFLIGAILAPTDAALGLPIFTNKRVPVRIRRALNVESGLNDGVATPFVTLFTALVMAEMTHNLTSWFAFAVVEIAKAIAVGAVLGMLGGWLFAVAIRRRLTSRATEQIGTLALALATYFVSVALGGNGFIAAFVGGLFFSYITRHRQHHALEFTESTGTMLSLFAWTIFGSLIVIPLFTAFQPLALVYAVLSLTLIRMLPVAISLIGVHFRLDTQLLMGWLGPRGLASVVFTLIAYESFQEIGRSPGVLFAIAGWTIFLSVLLHGFSALPLARWYGNRLKSTPRSIPELLDVPELEQLEQQVRGLQQTPSEPAGSSQGLS
jgi:NhaP-type Na+/H+ or K+/H+ antiporter